MYAMRLPLLLLVTLMPALAAAKPVRKAVPYKVGDAAFEGVLLYDDADKTPKPGLLVVPNWMGITEDNVAQAQEFAGSKYVVFVADMYGAASRPKSPAEAGALVAPLKADRAVLRARVNAALAQLLALAKEAPLDAKKVAAAGYCFGGTTVLESGADLKAVVSFHGGLDAKVPLDAKPKARILALHGAEDPTFPATDLQAFQDDLRKSGADWTLVSFGGAVHSFTDPKANVPGRAMYDAKTAKRAYAIAAEYLSESFAE